MFELFVEFADGTELKSAPVTGTENEMMKAAEQLASFQIKMGKDVLSYGCRPRK
jgi:hypothetical protein